MREHAIGVLASVVIGGFGTFSALVTGEELLTERPSAAAPVATPEPVPWCYGAHERENRPVRFFERRGGSDPRQPTATPPS